MTKKTRTAFSYALALVLVGSFGLRAYAANLTIICNPGLESASNCDVTPVNTPAVFDESEYPLFDLKPGDFVERQITVTNNREEECYFWLDTVVIDEDTVASTGERFSEELITEFDDNYGPSTGPISFYQLLTTVPVYLTTLAPSETRTIDWTVTFDPQAGNEFQNARLQFDFDWSFECGGEPPVPELFIDKTNNKLGIVQEPGADVTYILTVTAGPDYPVYNVYVLDLPPGGFTYVGGSWTAHSSVRGDIKNSPANPMGPTTEPTYASPGEWFLGNMEAGEVVTLTYVVDIDPTQESGIYKDLAWTWGTVASDPTSTMVRGNEPTGFFVGTSAVISIGEDVAEVEIEVETEEIEEEEEEVLGISTELPATGARNIWIGLITFFSVSGFLLLVAAMLLKNKTTLLLLEVKPTPEGTGASSTGGSKQRRLKNAVAGGGSSARGPSARTMLGYLVFASAAAAVFTTHTALAQSLDIRLEEPESPSNLDEFYLNFVTLDVENRPISVECYKQAPGEATFSKFGPTFSITPPGDDGFCTVNSSMLPDDGTYRFYVQATAGIDVETSSIVPVDYDAEKPGKPKYIEKEKDGSCKYEVTFKTADDGGDTVSVKVYMSTEKQFETNSSTETESFAIGSNEKKTFIDDKPLCDRTYYYAVRAFDSAGNASAVRAEEVEKTVTKTTTTKKSVFEELIQAAAAESGEGVGVEPGESGETEVVIGEETEEEVGPGETGEEGTEVVTEEGEVLGKRTWRDFFEGLIGLWPLLILLSVVAYYYYAKVQQDKNDSTRKPRQY